MSYYLASFACVAISHGAYEKWALIEHRTAFLAIHAASIVRTFAFDYLFNYENKKKQNNSEKIQLYLHLHIHNAHTCKHSCISACTLHISTH